MSEPILEVDRITKSFGPIRAIDGISLTVSPGEVVGLVGDNGAGKSTLVKIISGVYAPTSGEVRLENRPVYFANPADARRAGIETVYQDLALCNNLDVAQNFFLGRERLVQGPARLFGALKLHEMRTEAAMAIRNLHIRIPGLASNLIGEMSGGQRQAVAIARAAFWNSKLLLLDEPTAALGVAESAEVARLIRDMSVRGMSMLIISHNMQEVWALCDRIVVLRQGHHAATLVKNETTPERVVGYITGARAA
ncbi:MAG: ATP-binding cassette domain-containing protein [Thermomicrobiales bacterium]